MLHFTTPKDIEGDVRFEASANRISGTDRPYGLYTACEMIGHQRIPVFQYWMPKSVPSANTEMNADGG